jgi:hypothetical protein
LEISILFPSLQFPLLNFSTTFSIKCESDSFSLN